MNIDEVKEFEDDVTMTKEEAINEIKKFFKGNKKFIEHATAIIYSTHHFEKLSRMQLIKNNYNWEKLLAVHIDTQTGFKHFLYKKGNEKYAPTAEREGNKTHDIDEFSFNVYYRETGELEQYTF